MVRVSDLSTNTIKSNIENIYLDESFEIEYEKYKLKLEDIIITTVGSKADLKESAVGRPIIINKENEGLLNQNLVKIYSKNGYNAYFTYMNLLRDNYTNYIKMIERGNANQANIAINDLWDYSIYFPSYEEQEYIGELFRQLDNTIALHQQKLEKLVQIKRGMLQLKFPSKGMKTPLLRFTNFHDHWEKRKFNNIANIRRGLTYKPSDVSKCGMRVLRSSNINGDTFELKSDDIFVNKDAVKIEPVKNEDILITSANGSSKLVGKHAIISGINEKMIHGGFMLLASSSQPYFVNALMSTTWYYKFIHIYVLGGNGAIGNLSKNNLEEQIVKIPSEEEQSKVGLFFKKLDNTIALHHQKIIKLNEIKKAFLQKMFI